MFQQRRQRGKPTRKFRITREGKWFLLLLLGVGMAAFNTGNNLLYLVLSLKICLFLVQLFLAEFNLKNVSLRRTAPHRAVAGALFPVTLHITNENKRLPIFGIQLRDVIDGERFKRSGHFLKAGPLEARHIEYQCELFLRGRSHFDGILLSTAFPFGLTERAKLIPLSHEIIVWPAKEPVHLPRHFSPVQEGTVPISFKGAGDEFWQLKEFQQGEDARRISWKASARQNRLILMETQARSDRKAHIVLLLGASDTGREKEMLIRVTASLTDELHRRNIPVSLSTSRNHIIHSRQETAAPLLDHLALMKTDMPSPPAENIPFGALIVNSATAKVFLKYPVSLQPTDVETASASTTGATTESTSENRRVAP
ncbi:MAG: DUF58 domain-containing protein [Deltaproteobacteria bacterium]|nr:DUF58 domain-containing protein [Deltaproteobacteria bacterium]